MRMSKLCGLLLLVPLLGLGCDPAGGARLIQAQAEICDDLIDNDNDGDVDCGDRDCIGSCDEACGDLLDNDGDSLVDCLDPDCDGHCPEVCSDERDNDGDDLTDCEDPDCRLCPFEVCDDGWDNDGDLLADCADPDCYADCDQDGDGYLRPAQGGGDCNDRNPDIHPGAPELCNGKDDDCDGAVDSEDPDAIGLVAFVDADGDGFGNPQIGSCVNAPGLVTNGLDCNDAEDLIHPGADEVCNGLDDDCDLFVDDVDPSVTIRCDNDGDGFAALSHGGQDCDDTNPAIGPHIPEVCNGIDDDCDSIVDDGDPDLVGSTWFADLDRDGFGDFTNQRCNPSSITVADGTDCADNDPFVNPAADEICNQQDDDCDDLYDDADPGLVNPTVWYPDGDGDGYGDTLGTPVYQCVQPVGHSREVDCDDTDPLNGPPDEWYQDVDGDGATLDVPAVLQCGGTPPAGLVAKSYRSDCADTDPDVGPGVPEVCGDGIDQDCDGIVDCPCAEIGVGLLEATGWTDPTAPFWPVLPWQDPTTFEANGYCPVRVEFLTLPLTDTQLSTKAITTVIVQSPAEANTVYDTDTIAALEAWLQAGGGLVVTQSLVSTAYDNTDLAPLLGLDPFCLRAGTSGGATSAEILRPNHPITWGQLDQTVELLSDNNTQKSCADDWRLDGLGPNARLVMSGFYGRNVVIAYEDAGRSVYFGGQVEFDSTPEGQQALYDALYWTSGWR